MIFTESDPVDDETVRTEWLIYDQLTVFQNQAQPQKPEGRLRL